MLDRFICHQPEEGDVPGRKNFDTTQVIGTGWKLLGGVVQLLLEYPSLVGPRCPSLCISKWACGISDRAVALRSEFASHQMTAVFVVGDVGI